MSCTTNKTENKGTDLQIPDIRFSGRPLSQLKTQMLTHKFSASVNIENT